jgi:flagellar hook protein FlgE
MSFQQGLSGLNATSKNLQVIGNNIANANTYGTKVSRAEFSDVYANALNGAGANSVGIGTTVTSVAQQFTQGTIKITDNPMDLAINGAGFFQVAGPDSAISYTRNGQFKVDREGYIVNNGGLRLMGYATDGLGGVLPGVSAALQLPTSGIAPAATAQVGLEFNLDSRSAVTVPGTGPAIDFSDARTYNNATSMTVYDLQGREVALTYYFQKSGDNAWNVFATANGNTVAGTAAAPLPVTTMTFAADGSAPTAPAAPVTFDIPATTLPGGGTTEAIAGVELDLLSATQFGASFGVTDATQDGYAAGQLTAIVVEGDGVVTARYSNGRAQAAGQIEIANFRNPQGLQPLGDNRWGRTNASGEAILGVPGQGNLGVLQDGALEESNIDLTGELVNMIVAQRIYQANAQTIKTQDQVLQTLVNLR